MKTWLRVVLVFLSMGIVAALWVVYVRAIGQHESLMAASVDVVLFASAAFVTVSYVEDRRMVLPAALGCFVGTYITSLLT